MDETKNIIKTVKSSSKKKLRKSSQNFQKMVTKIEFFRKIMNKLKEFCYFQVKMCILTTELDAGDGNWHNLIWKHSNRGKKIFKIKCNAHPQNTNI